MRGTNLLYNTKQLLKQRAPRFTVCQAPGRDFLYDRGCLVLAATGGFTPKNIFDYLGISSTLFSNSNGGLAEEKWRKLLLSHPQTTQELSQLAALEIDGDGYVIARSYQWPSSYHLIYKNNQLRLAGDLRKAEEIISLCGYSAERKIINQAWLENHEKVTERLRDLKLEQG
jgi:hypothetical protein